MSSQAATRAELMRRLSILSTEELLSFLKDETIFEIAEAYFEKLNNDAQSSANLKACGHIAPSTATPSRSPATDRAKRPLNAFMAFRSEQSVRAQRRVSPDLTLPRLLLETISRRPAKDSLGLLDHAVEQGPISQQVGAHRQSLFVHPR